MGVPEYFAPSLSTSKLSLAANYDPELVPALAPYRHEVLKKYMEIEPTMATGGLWGV